MSVAPALLPVQLLIVDFDPDVVAACASAFRLLPEVRVELGDLLARAHHAVVSPANSDGFMDGGIDHAIARYFGARVERQVRAMIRRRPEGHLPVGSALAVPTGDARIPFLVVAPTMRTPGQVDAQNAYRALRAVLRCCTAEPQLGGAVFCPGLATGVGGVDALDAARAMAEAYSDWRGSAVPVAR